MGFLVFIAYLLCTILNIKEFNNTRKYYDSILQIRFGLRNNRRWYLDKILRMNEMNPSAFLIQIFSQLNAKSNIDEQTIRIIDTEMVIKRTLRYNLNHAV